MGVIRSNGTKLSPGKFMLGIRINFFTARSVVPVVVLTPFSRLSNFQTRLRGAFGNKRLAKNPLPSRH